MTGRARPAYDPWRDVDGTSIPVGARVEQVAVAKEHGARSTRLRQRGDVIRCGSGTGRGHLRLSPPGRVPRLRRGADADRRRPEDAVMSDSMRATVGLLAERCPVCVVSGRDELQPKIDWDKGKAVLFLMDVLGLDSEDVVPLYLGDDITDEDAFRVLRGRGVGIIVGRGDDPEVAGRATAAQFVLSCTEEVQRFLTVLAR